MAKTKRRHHRANLKLPSDISQPTPLPAELLWDIFDLVKSNRPPQPSTLSAFAPELQWIPEITHVCRQWRAVALGDASLWSDVFVTASNRWATELVARSRDTCPLRIVADFSIGAAVSGSHEARRKANIKTYRALLKKSQARIESLIFDNLGEDLTEDIITVDDHREVLPAVKEVTVIGLKENYWNPYVIKQLVPDICYIFHPQNLTMLDLRRCPIDWKFLRQFVALSFLRVERYQMVQDDDSPADIRASLNALEHLRELHIDFGGMPEGNEMAGDDFVSLEEPNSSMYEGNLSRLHHIQLYYPSTKWIRHILHGITPLDKYRHPDISTRTLDIGAPDFSSHFPLHHKTFPTVLQLISPSNVIVVRIGMFYNMPSQVHRIVKGFTLSFWNKTVSTSDREHDNSMPPLLKYRAGLNLYYEGLRVTTTTAFNLLCSSASYDNLEQLELNDPRSFTDAQVIANSIGLLPRLQLVRMKCKDVGVRRSMGEFFKALIFNTDESNSHNIPFSMLRSIYIRGSLGIDAQVERTILEVMEERHDLDFPISELGLPPEDSKEGYLRDEEALLRVISSIVVLNDDVPNDL